MPDSTIPFFKRMFGKKRERRAQGPMLWSTGEGSGFSMGEPWIPFARGANRLSVENQLLEEGSTLQLYRTLINLRKTYQALSRGVCTFVATGNPHILAYQRKFEEETFLILLNFNERNQGFSSKHLEVNGRVIFSTHREVDNPDEIVHLVELGSHEGVIIRLA